MSAKVKALIGIATIVVAAGLVWGIGRSMSGKPPAAGTVGKPAAVGAKTPESAPAILSGDSGHFAKGVSYAELGAQDAKVRPAVRPYTVKPGLANIVNLKQFKGLLAPQDVKLLEKNGFFATPTDYTQLFYVYENNAYQRPQLMPSFITVDSMLHTYHIFYDYSLRQVESTKLYDAAVKLTDAMLAASQRDLQNARSVEIKDAARRNVAYFALARQLLAGTTPPPDVKTMVAADLKQVMAHKDRTVSHILGYKINFSQMVPRGHYTRTEKLKRYFRGMMWYGLAPLPIPEQGKLWDERPTRQALMIVRTLRTGRAGAEPLLKLWDTIYEPTVFYVGKADDHDVYQYGALMDRVYGGSSSIEDFADKAKIDEFIALVRKMRGPAIANASPDLRVPSGPQFRFMGQRFVADSFIFQELVHPKAWYRAMPTGLDIFAAMGSDRALDNLHTYYKPQQFAGYSEQMDKLRKQVSAIPDATWQSNLYWGWLWTLQSMVKPLPAGYPQFMRSAAWLDCSLYGALGSWTELRHDTILYAKQSEVECGGDGEEEPPTPRGYVEPNLAVWTRLKWLNSQTLAGLKSRHLLSEELQLKFQQLGDWLDFCRKISVKELTNQKVTEGEYKQISLYGAELEQMTTSFAGGDLLSDADKDMAIVADVHTDAGHNKCLEEGTGRAAAIYVVVPIEGKLYLTRGAIYTQYEFDHPMSDRLTDEQWQKMLQGGKLPGLAPWVKTFLTPGASKLPMEFYTPPAGC